MESGRFAARFSRFRIRVMLPLFLLWFAFYFASNATRIFQDFQVYRFATSSPGVEGTVVDSKIYRNMVVGEIKFALAGPNTNQECVVVSALAQESFKNDFLPGKTIKVVPRSGCENPIIATDKRSPLFDVFLLAAPTIMAGFAARHMIKNFRA